jgi:hypothetical protein
MTLFILMLDETGLTQNTTLTKQHGLMEITRQTYTKRARLRICSIGPRNIVSPLKE